MSLPSGYKKVNELNSANDAPKESAPKGGGIDKLGDELLESMSDVQPHVIEAHERIEEEKKAEEASKWDGLVDPQGRAFDPSIHRTKANGDPYVTSRGKLSVDGKKLKGGKRESYIGGRGAPKEGRGAPEKNISQQSRACASVITSTLITLGYAIGGEEWKPMRDDETGLNETDMLTNAFTDYFEAKGITDIPPSFGVAIAVSAYVAPRLTMPKTQTRLAKVKNWIALKIADRKVRKFGGKVVKDNEGDK